MTINELKNELNKVNTINNNGGFAYLVVTTNHGTQYQVITVGSKYIIVRFANSDTTCKKSHSFVNMIESIKINEM